jgi:putative hydrolase of the HAD superfamily
MLFRSLTRRHFGLFPSVLDTLTSLGKKYIVAIISDAQWVFAEPEMKMLGLDRFFRLRILSSRFGFKKPDVRLFKIAMEKLKVRPDESVYIGDNPDKDLFGARGAGMKCVLFRSDSLPYNDFFPDRRFFDYSELERVISEIL